MDSNSYVKISKQISISHTRFSSSRSNEPSLSMSSTSHNAIAFSSDKFLFFSKAFNNSCVVILPSLQNKIMETVDKDEIRTQKTFKAVT